MRGIIRNTFLLAPDIAKGYMLSVSKHMRNKVHLQRKILFDYFIILQNMFQFKSYEYFQDE